MDIRHIVRDFLREQGFDAQFTVPADITDGLVTVETLGGGGSTPFVRSIVVNVQCWAATRGRADAECDRAYHALIRTLEGADPDIVGVYPDEPPHEWDDPDTLPSWHRSECSVTVYMNE